MTQNADNLHDRDRRDYVRVFIRDYVAQLRVGIRESEKHGPQTVIVNVECEGEQSSRYDDPGEDNVDRVINYSQIYDFIATELPKAGHIPLLETVAEMIIALCFRDPHVMNARVRLEKPNRKPGVASVGVEMFRTRSGA